MCWLVGIELAFRLYALTDAYHRPLGPSVFELIITKKIAAYFSNQT